MIFRLKRPEPTEAQAMAAIRAALSYHPAVKALWRVNSGSMTVNEGRGRRRFVRFHDIAGCSDLIGILNDGRWLAVECKRPSTRNEATDAQLAFLETIKRAGGIAFVAAAADEARQRLDEALQEVIA